MNQNHPERQKNLSVMIVAGGTGGHISPGIAIASSFFERGIPVSFLSIEKNRNYPGFQDASYPVDYYPAPLPGGGLRLVRFLLQFPLAVWKALRIMGKRKTSVLVLMGGYPILPAAVAGILSFRTIYLCEQNAIHGKAVRWLRPFAKATFLTFPETPERKDGIHTGNPLRQGIVETAAAAGDTAEGPAKNGAGSLNILVLGGSQGAVQLNRMVQGALDRLEDVNWVLQCGEKNLGEMEESLKDRPIEQRPHLFGFHNRIHEFYSSADILVCRSGAGVVTEGALFGLPMILVPYPYATDNHQDANATIFEKAGAAFVIRSKESDSDRLVEILQQLQKDRALLKRMGEASASLAKPHAAGVIVSHIAGEREGES